MPFEVIGAPWIDGRTLAATLMPRTSLPTLRPITFTPDSSVYKGERLGGVNIILTDRNALRSFAAAASIATILKRLYPSDWHADKFARPIVNQQIIDLFNGGMTSADLVRSAEQKRIEFLERRKPFLLYK